MEGPEPEPEPEPEPAAASGSEPIAAGVTAPPLESGGADSEAAAGGLGVVACGFAEGGGAMGSDGGGAAEDAGCWPDRYGHAEPQVPPDNLHVSHLALGRPTDRLDSGGCGGSTS